MSSMSPLILEPSVSGTGAGESKTNSVSVRFVVIVILYSLDLMSLHKVLDL